MRQVPNVVIAWDSIGAKWGFHLVEQQCQRAFVADLDQNSKVDVSDPAIEKLRTCYDFCSHNGKLLVGRPSVTDCVIEACDNRSWPSFQ